MNEHPCCLSALPTETLALMGYEDLGNPHVTVDFRLEEGLRPFKGTTTDHRLLQRWLSNIPRELRDLVEGRRLCLRVDSAGETVLENGQPVTDVNVLQFAESLLVNLRAEQGLMTEIIAHLPTREELRNDLDACLRARLKLALENGERVDDADWQIVSGCEDCCPHGRDWLQAAVTARDVFEPQIRIPDYPTSTFVLPLFTPGRCADVTPLRLNVALMMLEVAKLLLPELLPVAYADLAPEATPGLVYTPDSFDVDITIVTLGW